MFSVSIVSDLHFVFYSPKKHFNWEPTDLLILAGDVFEHNSLKTHHDFLDYISSTYKHCLYVPGNHEYYNTGLKRGFKELKDLETNYPNIHILNNESFVYEQFVFLGSTLWTSLNNYDPITLLSSHVYLNDYLMIKDDFSKPEKKLTTKKVVQLFDESLQFLTKQTSLISKKTPLFIITHHAPSLQSIAPCYRCDNFVINGNFVSDLDSWILKRKNIVFWVHGHTHTPFDYQIGRCRVLCNPRGYPQEISGLEYQPVVLNL